MMIADSRGRGRREVQIGGDSFQGGNEVKGKRKEGR